MKLTLKIWRQAGPEAQGQFENYAVDGVEADMSFLEVLDLLNEKLLSEGKEPVAYEMDCREGICGSCCLMINGQAHGPLAATTSCQLYMRHFRDGDLITVEPWRAQAIPVIKDLVVDRSSMDRVMQAAGYLRQHRSGAGRQCDSRFQVQRRLCIRSGKLYRLWCLHCCLPQRFRDVIRCGKGHTVIPASTGAAGTSSSRAVSGGSHGPRGLWKLQQSL